ncbi:MAG TPA: NAD(P)-dependent oxidoreductase [Gammaproteobacteria bacterium]|nr:NAD(P)-dependent oxidoreductase [Gammaproteobacteria bacterium]
MQIAILGTGAMGSRMAARLLEVGHHVTVFNRHPHTAQALVMQGAVFAATPAAAVRDAEVVLAMLTDDAASRQVWLDERDGALAAMGPDALALECSTLSVAWCDELAACFQARHSAFLDAPVVGSRPQAEAGALIFLVGGDAAALARATSVLDCLGAGVHHVGPAGSATRLKLAVNALFGIQVAALGELTAWLAAEGLDHRQTLARFAELPTTSPALAGIAALMAGEDTAPRFPIALVAKDFGYAMQAATEQGAALPLTQATQAIYRQAVDAGLGGLNINGVAELYT